MPSATSDVNPPPAGAFLAAVAVGKTYRRGVTEVRALRGATLDIARGGVTFIVGPSGSGKSTLLHLLGALDRPTAGRVLFEGRDLSALSDRELSLFRRRHVGFIFQSFHLVPALTATDNVLLPRMPEGIRDQDRRRARDLLSRFGLGERLDHRPHELSGGESQRVAIARALLYDPSLVLADEPTGELDSTTGAEVFGYLRRAVREGGKTLVVVTHDTGLLEPGDRIVRFRDGNIVEDSVVPQGPPPPPDVAGADAAAARARA